MSCKICGGETDSDDCDVHQSCWEKLSLTEKEAIVAEDESSFSTF
jgi:hypothetical protein